MLIRIIPTLTLSQLNFFLLNFSLFNTKNLYRTSLMINYGEHMATTTAKVFWAAIGTLVIYDIYAYTQGKETITGFIRRISGEYPVVPLATGIVVGHLFWVKKQKISA